MVLSYVAALAAAYFFTKSASFFWTYCRPSSLPKYLHHCRKSYALITGASDGIGFGLAEEFCSRNFNVILHGRNQSKLTKLKETLSASYPKVDVQILVLDALSATVDDMQSAIQQVQDLHITALVNNIGGTGGIVSSAFLSFSNNTFREIDDMITLNLRFTTLFTRAFLPILTRNGPSLILNLGSQGDLGVAYLPIYSSTKSYIRALTRALSAEFKAEGINIEVLDCAGGSIASAQNPAEATLMRPSSRRFAKACLDSVGCGQTRVVPYLPHGLQELLLGVLLPNWLVDTLIAKQLKPMADNKAKTW